MLPDLYAHLTPWLRPFFESSLTLATVVAVALNQLLRVEENLLLRRKPVPTDAGQVVPALPGSGQSVVLPRQET